MYYYGVGSYDTKIEINIHITNGPHARAVATLIAKLSGILLTMNLFMKHNHY